MNLVNFKLLMVLSTQDCIGIEQESLCIRYVDRDLEVHEYFDALYKTQKILLEQLLTNNRRLEDLKLSIANLRGQTYDAAANVTGICRGCQILIREKQPLALLFHCGAQWANLVAQHAMVGSSNVRDATQ